MLLRSIFLTSLIVVSACSKTHDLAKCGGPAVPLNAGRWEPSDAQRAEMDRLLKEACK